MTAKVFRCTVCNREQLAHSDEHPNGLHAEEARAIGWRQDFAGLVEDVANPRAGRWYCPFHSNGLELGAADAARPNKPFRGTPITAAEAAAELASFDDDEVKDD